MRLKEFLTRDEPLLEKIFTFAKANATLTLGMWAALATAFIFGINALEHCYHMGYYSFGFNVPITFLGEIHAKGLPFSFVLVIAVFVFMVLYASAISEAYIHCHCLKFLFRTSLFTMLASVIIILLFLFSSLGYHNLIETLTSDKQFFPSVLGLTLFLFTIMMVVLIILFLCTYSCQSDEDRVKHYDLKLQHAKKNQFNRLTVLFSKIPLLGKQLNPVCRYQQKRDEANARSEQYKGKDAENPCITVKKTLVCAAISFALLAFLCQGFGLLFAQQTTNFKLIDTDQAVFSQRIMDELDKMTENDEVIGLVQLCQNEEHIMIAPCIYSEIEGEITIYTAYQHVMPVENTSFVHKSFQYKSIQ